MPRRSEAADRQALAALFARMENQPSVAATKALLRAAFLFVNSPDRPFHEFGLSVSEVDVLSAIARSEAMALNCSELAEATLITKGGITGVLDRLVARGFVQRTPSRDDRRSIRIGLTDKGVEFCQELFQKVAHNDEEAFARALRPEQIKQLAKMLTALVRSFEAESGATRTSVSEATHGYERV